MIRRKYNLNVCLGIALGTILLTLILGTLQKQFGIFNGADELAIQIAKAIRFKFLNLVMNAITSLGEEMGLMPVLCIVFWLGYTAEAITFLLLLLFGGIINNRMKEFFELVRPPEQRIEWLSHAEGYGYPSGHSQNGMFYSWLVYAFVRDYWYLCLIPAFLMAATRIYLGVHFFSDTVGGLICGFGIAVAATGIYGHVRDLTSIRESIRRSHALKVILSFVLSAIYLVLAWGLSADCKYAGLLAGFFSVYSMLGFRWCSRTPFRTVIMAVLGMVVMLSIRGGLKWILPENDPADYLRYLLVGVALAGSPFVFVKVGLLRKVDETTASEGGVCSETER